MKCYRYAAVMLFFTLQSSLLFAQTADQTEGCAAFAVSFTPPSGQTSFYWEFGDGGVSTEENAQRIYASPGTYEAIFRNMMGGPQVGESITISVYPKPTVTFSADPDGGCAPLTTELTATFTADPAINIFSVLWDFGDSGSQNEPNTDPVTHVYNNPGDFDVSIGWTTNFQTCNDVQIAADLVSASGPPGVGFLTNPNPPISCTAPLEVSFINVSLDQTLDWQWEFGNGGSSTDLNPDPETYTTVGSATVTLIGTDVNGCSGTASQVISIGEPTADFSPAQDTVCLGALPIPMINNSSAGTYEWTFDNGAFPGTSTQNSPLVQFNNVGVTNITLTVTSPDGQCSSMTTGQVFVDDPDATFESIPTFSCTNILDAQFVPVNTMAAQYIWSFEGGGTSNDMSPTFTYENLDTTTHSINGLLEFVTTLTIVSEAGCTATFTQTDTIHQPNALYYPDIVEGCVPLEVNFENRTTPETGIVSYFWDFGDGTTLTDVTGDDMTHIYEDPGEFETVLIVTNDMGCMDTSYIQIIEAGDALSPSFTLTAVSICPGDSVTVQDMTNSDLIDAWHFSTDANRSFHCYQEDQLTHIFDTETGVFDVTLTVEYNGCYSEVTQTDLIEVNGPIAKIDYLVDCNDPFNISFRDSSLESTTTAWDFGDGGVSGMTDPFHTYADTGDYQVILFSTNSSGLCPVSSDTVTVYVRDIEAQFDLDSLLCLGLPYDLDASASVNVDADCHTGYTWYFSDPNDRPITTQETVVEHVFEQRGINFVTLITDDINGCRDTIVDTVKVFGVYPEILAMPTPICIPGTVNFSSVGTTADTTIDNYMWDFGDGMMSEDLNPSHEYLTPPTNGTSFQVILTVEDVIPCSGMGIIEVPIYTPVSEITASPKVDICVGETIDFSASDFTDQGSNLDWTWSFGAGATPSTGTGQNVAVTYNTSGTYQVVLNYSEQSSSCAGIPDTLIVTVQDFPTADFTSNVDLTQFICAPEIITFTDASISNTPLSVVWDWGEGLTPGSEVTNTFVRGQYILNQFVSTSNGCADTLMTTFELKGPEGTLEISNNNICYGDEIEFTLADTIDIGTFQIDFGDGSAFATTSPVTHIYDGPYPGDSIVVQLLLEDASGDCQVTNLIPVFFEPIDVSFAGFPETGCVGDELVYNAVSSSATSYNWDFGNSTTSNTQLNNITFDAAGEYIITLEVSNALGCTFFITDTTDIATSPELNTPAPLTVCASSVVDLTVTGGDASDIYQWEPSGLVVNPTASSTETNVSAAELPSANFEFTVTATNLGGCSDSEILVVNAIPEFIEPDLDSFNICPGGSFVLPLTNTGGFFDYTWDATTAQGSEGVLSESDRQMIIDGLENSDNNPIFVAPVGENLPDSIRLTLSANVIDGNGDCDGQWDITVRLLSKNVPNAFTPDNDGRNDFFDFGLGEIYDIKTFQIFNRWGQKVYDNETPATGWDGMWNGKPAATEVYIYTFETTNEECSFRGNVTLLR